MSRATYKQRIEMFLSMSTLKGTFHIVTVQLASFNHISAQSIVNKLLIPWFTHTKRADSLVYSLL